MGTDGFGLFGIFQLAIAAYLAYSAITGKGKLFENNYLKEEISREKYVLTLRILGGVTALFIALNSVLEMTGVVQAGTVVGWVLWALGFACIVLLMIYTVRSTDRKASKAGRPTSSAEAKPDPYKGDPLRAAFVFDDDEATEQVDGDKERNNEEK